MLLHSASLHCQGSRMVKLTIVVSCGRGVGVFNSMPDSWQRILLWEEYMMDHSHGVECSWILA